MALIQLYQFLLSIKLSFRVMSLSAAVGIRDPGEESMRNPSLIILTLNLQDLVFYLTWDYLKWHASQYYNMDVELKASPVFGVGLQQGSRGAEQHTQLLLLLNFRQ